MLEELRMLSNLETPNSKLIQIVFVGQPELETKLNSRELRQLKQRIAIRSQIRLTADESRQYIDHRLRLVGKSAGEIFSPEAVALIVRHAEGIPRTINLLCDNALLIGYRRKERKFRLLPVRRFCRDRGMGGRKTEKGGLSAKMGLPRLAGSSYKEILMIKPFILESRWRWSWSLFFLPGIGALESSISLGEGEFPFCQK